MKETHSIGTVKDRPQTPAGIADQTGGENEHTHSDVSTVLRVKRWDLREGPFRGFDSPPGRF